MPTSSIFFTPSRRKNHGIRSMNTISDICPMRHLPGRVRHAYGVEKRVGKRVIELQRDTHQE